MKIAVCDDETILRKNLVKDLKTCLSSDFVITEYNSALSLLKDYTTHDYDLLFLDIIMDKLNGFEAAKKIREIDTEVKIVFCTSSIDYITESYLIDANAYLIKPYKIEVLKSILDKLTKNEETLLLENGKGLNKVSLSKIIYIESEGRKLSVHLSDDAEPIEIYSKLSDLELKLPQPKFLRTHQSYIVNQDYITAVDSNSFVLTNGDSVLIRTKEKPQIVDKWFSYLAQKDLVTL